MKKLLTIVVVIGVAAGAAFFFKAKGLAKFNGKKGFKPFAVYTESGAQTNHYVPSGLMGDFGDLSVVQDSHENPRSGSTCIKISYSAQALQKQGWAGIYWQHPEGNWGKNEKGGFNLVGAKKISFWARGAKGGEFINEFKVGGINDEYGDTATKLIGLVTLTSEWKQYSIDLAGADLSNIIGGFCFSAAKASNPDGFVMYLDDIVYE